MDTVRVLAVGDIGLQTPQDRHPFEGVIDVLAGKDILFGNLETVLSDAGKKEEKAMLVHSSPHMVSGLVDAGFDILSVANNHIMDLGPEGFRNTLEALRRAGLKYIGASDGKGSSHVIVEKHGMKLGFLAYYEWGTSLPSERIHINRITPGEIEADIASLKRECDSIIVSLHWGTENVFYPSPQQIETAHALIDAGADVILGHHPHVVQGLEPYKRGLIAYSLGNFQFRYGKSADTMILCLEFGGGELRDYGIIPAAIDDYYRPVAVDGGAFPRFLEEISRPLREGTVSERWWFEQIAPEYIAGNFRSFVTRIRKYGLKHLVQCIIWLISPFCLRCYAAILRLEIRKFFKGK
ncbi:MAG: CapA family protein [Actinomycetota bacterium]|nr:CapA family protein [Actinomycetota bacterium]